jgi:hypothetical protein
MEPGAIRKPPLGHVAVRAPCGDPGNRARLIEAAEKLLFNIGRIPVRQSREPVLQACKRQILPPGRKGMPSGGCRFAGRALKPLKSLGI